MERWWSSTFRSLRGHNYRLWAAGALVSNIGTGMQRIAQDWLVLTQLTHRNATAVGLVMALQFGPQLLMLPWTGSAADRFDRRKLLLATQAAMAALALGLGLLTVWGLVRLWQVDLFALLLGCVTAFDAPARHTFVSELVGPTDLSNAVALNSTSFTAAQMIGPALAGLLIARFGCGWAFLINAVSFGALIAALCLLRVETLRREAKAPRGPGHFTQGFHYAWRRPDLRATLVMLALIGTFGFNFPIFISTMATKVFHAGAGAYGFLTATMAVGTVAGALLSAGRKAPDMGLLGSSAALFGAGFALAAIMPNARLFGGALAIIGLSALTFTTATNSLMQLATEPAMRGRIMALRLAVALGGTPVGAPITGWVADRLGPRWALGLGAAAGLIAAAVAMRHLRRDRDRDRDRDLAEPECARGR